MELQDGSFRRLTEEEVITYPDFKYVVTKEYTLTYPTEDSTLSIVVPRGFLSDGASKAPDLGRSWMIHDYLYATHSAREANNNSNAMRDIELASVDEEDSRLNFTTRVKVTRSNADQIMSDILDMERRDLSRYDYGITHKCCCGMALKKWLWWSLGWKFRCCSRNDCTGSFGRAWRNSGERGPVFVTENVINV